MALFEAVPPTFQTILTTLLPLFLQAQIGCAQNIVNQDSSDTYRQRKIVLATAGGGVLAGSLIGLNELWYDEHDRESFHFFNDQSQWLQVDKAGHFMTSYYLGSIGHSSMCWTGAKEKNAVLLGGSLGLIYLTGIEVLDGFSSEWGFSVADEMANVGGALFFMSQQWLWQEQRIKVRYNFLQSKYAKYRPELLGSSPAEQWLKDYNGQAYWLSFNVYSFLNESSAFPKWLNVAVGYGADGMVSGDRQLPDHLQGEIPEFERQRQLYLSLDIDLSKIESNSRFFNGFSKVIGFLKIPAPAIEFNQSEATRFYWFH